MIDRRPPVEQTLRERMMSNTFYQQSPTLADALGPELERKRQLLRIRYKYGFPPERRVAPRGQWEGEDHG